MKPRTSKTHPLKIDTVSVPTGSGQIGMTLCPGRRGMSVSGLWERDLAADIDVIIAWNPQLVLTLLEPHEFASLGVPDFRTLAMQRFRLWRQLPIVDGSVPDEAFETAWRSVGVEAREILGNGGKVLIHCRAGLGRTGMIAARLLVELGSSPDEAIRLVRDARPKTIETTAQEHHVRKQRRVFADPIQDRVYGMMLGAAIGDALGSAFEFLPSERIRSLVGDNVIREYTPGQPGSLMPRRKPGIPTDDTAMTLALVDALTAPESPSPDSIQAAFGRALHRGTGRFADLFWDGAPGNACVAMLRAFDTGTPPFVGINPNAGGNGAAMRAHPCGVFADRDVVIALSDLQARISHPHASAVAAAQVVALVAHEALFTGRLTHTLPNEIRDPQMIRAWDSAHRSLFPGRELPLHLRDVDMAGWNTVAAAHAIAQLNEDDFATAVGVAAGSGGDTDTVAAIVGAFLGALHGYHALPQQLIGGLAHRNLVEGTAEALYQNIVIRERETAQRQNAGRSAHAKPAVPTFMIDRHEFSYRDDPAIDTVFFWRNTGNFDESFVRTSVITRAATCVRHLTGRKFASTVAAAAPEALDGHLDGERVERFEQLLITTLLTLGIDRRSAKEVFDYAGMPSEWRGALFEAARLVAETRPATDAERELAERITSVCNFIPISMSVNGPFKWVLATATQILQDALSEFNGASASARRGR